MAAQWHARAMLFHSLASGVPIEIPPVFPSGCRELRGQGMPVAAKCQKHAAFRAASKTGFFKGSKWHFRPSEGAVGDRVPDGRRPISPRVEFDRTAR